MTCHIQHVYLPWWVCDLFVKAFRGLTQTWNDRSMAFPIKRWTRLLIHLGLEFPIFLVKSSSHWRLNRIATSYRQCFEIHFLTKNMDTLSMEFCCYGSTAVMACAKVWPYLTIIFHIMMEKFPDSKAHGAIMGPTWVLLAPDGPHVGPTNLALRDGLWAHKSYVKWVPDILGPLLLTWFNLNTSMDK